MRKEFIAAATAIAVLIFSTSDVNSAPLIFDGTALEKNHVRKIIESSELCAGKVPVKTAEYICDENGRVVEMSCLEGSKTPSRKIVYSYDEKGMETGVEVSENGSPLERSENVYDRGGRLLEKRYFDKNGCHTFTVPMEYDSEGRKICESKKSEINGLKNFESVLSDLKKVGKRTFEYNEKSLCSVITTYDDSMKVVERRFFTYNPTGSLSEVFSQGSSGEIGGGVRYVYNEPTGLLAQFIIFSGMEVRSRLTYKYELPDPNTTVDSSCGAIPWRNPELESSIGSNSYAENVEYDGPSIAACAEYIEELKRSPSASKMYSESPDPRKPAETAVETAKPYTAISGVSKIVFSTANKSYEAVSKFMSENDTDVNMKNVRGTSILMMAAYWGNEPLARYLLENGADTAHRDGKGHALDYYIKNARKQNEYINGILKK